ncbi:hypothetical protein [Pengzhenrongella sicca]|uniref:Uncharacterized protein n=1 Tax=Pengzhenrongella sicca TaxID=2819238 RepID=A0A8A4ZEU8_9MICO|nr:hypothetical protein [Pengzhenrongella sicca]QTE29443.1 hypothetical protein J4E96_19660 [Pengzhenrongella sicca]
MNRLLPSAAAILAVAFVLTGCSGSDEEPAATESATAEASKPAPEKAEETEEATAAEEPAAAATGLSEPGTKAGIGEALTYEFTGSDDITAVVSTKLVSVEPASADEAAFLLEQIPALKGYKITLIRLEQTKVSGGAVAYSADYTSFSPVDTEGEAAQEVTMIGWDVCESNSFPTEFDESAGMVTQCLVGASVEGGNDIAGAMWDGGYADPNPYDKYQGKPLLFMK